MASHVPSAGAEQGSVSDAKSASSRHTPVRSILLVVLCTLIGAAAQILLRMGAQHVGSGDWLMSILTNLPLIAGYACLGANTLLLIVALRDGQLSVLYPIIALTYVWVAILSPMFFDDTLNGLKIAGVSLTVVGVSLIGAGSRQ